MANDDPESDWSSSSSSQDCWCLEGTFVCFLPVSNPQSKSEPSDDDESDEDRDDGDDEGDGDDGNDDDDDDDDDDDEGDNANVKEWTGLDVLVPRCCAGGLVVLNEAAVSLGFGANFTSRTPRFVLKAGRGREESDDEDETEDRRVVVADGGRAFFSCLPWRRSNEAC